MFKRNKLILFIVLTAALLFQGCSASGSKAYNDGYYYSEAADFGSSGWKEYVEITIENGEITDINWDAIYKDDSIPIRKKQYSKSGLYGMLTVGAINEWYDQAIAAETFVLENGIDALTFTDDGAHTDAVSSCTISVNEFDELLRSCLAQAEK
ncbi:FMN-binding protein [Tyzzerella sp. OttesenSCG-928-J15]|nr:FMN-binding protein [Tyzzerella sp. OttesenSCG-928-J15]